MKASADVISVDLPWESYNDGRTAIAMNSSESIRIIPDIYGDIELLEQVSSFAAQGALVLLDIPITGCRGLSSKYPFRPFERKLLKIGVPVLPSFKARGRGNTLRTSLLKKRPDLVVEESYPYATLRVLWALHLKHLKLFGAAFQDICLSDVWWNWPPRYKRDPLLESRRHAMEKVRTLLVKTLGSNIPQLYSVPDFSGFSALARIADQYDALLGLIAGIAMRCNSPWAWKAICLESGGSIVGIADEWLRTRFDEATPSE